MLMFLIMSLCIRTSHNVCITDLRVIYSMLCWSTAFNITTFSPMVGFLILFNNTVLGEKNAVGGQESALVNTVYVK